MTSEHPFLKFILPAKAFDAVRAGSKQWIAECPCGHKQDFWETGGIRYGAKSVSCAKLVHCPACGKRTMHTIRKKREDERQIGS